MGPSGTEVPMRCLFTLPHFNARHKVSPNRDSYIAIRIAAWSRSVSCGLLAASLILAACAPQSALAYGTGMSNRPATPAQGSSGRKTVIDVRTSPGIYLPGPIVRIEVFSTKPVTPRVLDFLQQNRRTNALEDRSQTQSGAGRGGYFDRLHHH